MFRLSECAMAVFTTAPGAKRTHSRDHLLKVFVRYLEAYEDLTDDEQNSSEARTINRGVYACLEHYGHNTILRIGIRKGWKR